MDEFSGEIGGNEPNVPANWRFSIEVATAWERAFFALELPRTRRIALRCAMIMSPGDGGAFDPLLETRAMGFGRYFWIRPPIRFLDSRRRFHPRDRIPHRAQRYFRSCQCRISSPYAKPQIHGLPSTFLVYQLYRIAYTGMDVGDWGVLLRTETELILKSRRVVPRRSVGSWLRFPFPKLARRLPRPRCSLAPAPRRLIANSDAIK